MVQSLCQVVVLCYTCVHSIGQHFLAGGLSGLMTTVIMTPGERVKCLMQARYHTSWHTLLISVYPTINKHTLLISVYPTVNKHTLLIAYIALLISTPC